MWCSNSFGEKRSTHKHRKKEAAAGVKFAYSPCKSVNQLNHTYFGGKISNHYRDNLLVLGLVLVKCDLEPSCRILHASHTFHVSSNNTVNYVIVYKLHLHAIKEFKQRECNLISKCIVFLLLTGVVATLAKSVKTCVLRLSPDKVCFVISEQAPVGGANIWCELSQVNSCFWHDHDTYAIATTLIAQTLAYRSTTLTHTHTHTSHKRMSLRVTYLMSTVLKVRMIAMRSTWR